MIIIDYCFFTISTIFTSHGQEYFTLFIYKFHVISVYVQQEQKQENVLSNICFEEDSEQVPFLDKTKNQSKLNEKTLSWIKTQINRHWQQLCCKTVCNDKRKQGSEAAKQSTQHMAT